MKATEAAIADIAKRTDASTSLVANAGHRAR
jgi:hypothetical protein